MNARRSMLRGFGRARATVVLVMVGALSLQAVPVTASAAPDPKSTEVCEDFDFAEGAPTEDAAASLAARCERNVPVASERAEFSDVYVKPDGTGVYTAHVEPVRARNSKGTWAPIDTTLRTRSDGSIAPGNAVLPVQISGGGTGDFARIAGDGKAFGLSWPGRLPKPSLNGSTATYENVLPGVDLTVTALAMGFSHELVVKDRTAAQSKRLERVRFGLSTKGLKARATGTGGIDAVDGDGAPWLAAPAPLMWDTPTAGDRAKSADRPGAGSSASRAPKEAVMDAVVTADSLILVPDTEVLRGDDVDYPVVIDPKWTGYKRDGDWGTVSEKYPGTSYWKSSHLLNSSDFGDAGAGRTCDSWTNFTCHTPSYRMRSFFRMNTEYVTHSDARVLKTATFKIMQEHAWVCHTSSPLSKAKVRRTSLFGSSHTWSNQPTGYSEYAHSTDYANHGAACSGGPGDAIFNVKSIVDLAESSSAYAVSLGMLAIDESTVAQWKRFDSSDVSLTLEYNTVPGDPKYLTAAGKGCGTDTNKPWVTTRKPQLSGRVYDADNSVRGHFWLYDYNAGAWDFLESKVTGYVSNSTRVNWTSGKTLSDGSYRWRMRASDGELYSDYTSYCYFKVDATVPSTPVIGRVNGDGPVSEGDSIQLKLSASDANGISRFEYGFDREARDKQVTASGNAATITFANLTKGRHVAYVWALDPAGNVSARGQFTFFVGTEFPATSLGAWRLDGDGVDDSGEANHLTVPSQASWTADRDGTADSAALLTGASGSCLESTKNVLDMRQSFSVGAWVRPDSLDSNGVVLAQVGANMPAFVLRYDKGLNRWLAMVSQTDNASTPWFSVRSSAGVSAGSWSHLAATIDVPARVLRLYVDGNLVGEDQMPYATWGANGPLLIGCEGRTTENGRWHHLKGAIDHVGAWQGLLTQAEVERAAAELPAGLVGEWRLRGSGDDTSAGGNPLAVPASATWTEDQYGRSGSAVELDGQPGSCLSREGPILRTDESFSVAAWVKVSDDGGPHPTIISQAGNVTSSFFLAWNRQVDRWVFVMPTKDGSDETVQWPGAFSKETVVRNTWQHLVGVYDKTAGVVRLYLDGELQETQAVSQTWHAAGQLRVGCSVHIGGEVSNWVGGAISNVAVYRGAMPGDQVKALVENPGIQLQGHWPLEGPSDWGDPNPAELRDVSGKERHLSINGDYQWVNDRANGISGALQLQLAQDSCAKTTGSVVRTDASFTVSAWVRLEGPSNEHRVLMAQGATRHQSFALMFHGPDRKVAFSVPSGDIAAPLWHGAAADSTSLYGKWTHLAGVFDMAAGKLRIYVDGKLAGEGSAPASPWHVDSPLTIGCLQTTDGVRSGYLNGVVDDVKVWSSTVHEDRILELAEPA